METQLSIWGLVFLLAVGLHTINSQNTTECKNLAMNIMCTNEHSAPPVCGSKSPLVTCAEGKEAKAVSICPNLAVFAKAFLQSTINTVETVCSDNEFSKGFQMSPDCWRPAAECNMKLGAVQEGKPVPCGRFNDSLNQCHTAATMGCSNLQTKFLKKGLARNPCFSEDAFKIITTTPSSSFARRLEVLTSSLSIFSGLILCVLI